MLHCWRRVTSFIITAPTQYPLSGVAMVTGNRKKTVTVDPPVHVELSRTCSCLRRVMPSVLVVANISMSDNVETLRRRLWNYWLYCTCIRTVGCRVSLVLAIQHRTGKTRCCRSTGRHRCYCTIYMLASKAPVECVLITTALTNLIVVGVVLDIWMQNLFMMIRCGYCGDSIHCLLAVGCSH